MGTSRSHHRLSKAGSGTILIAWACLTAAAPTLRAQSPATAEAPATQPASQPTEELSKVEIIERALKLTEAEADLYAVDANRRTQLGHQASLTMFMRRIRDLPALADREIACLDMPAVSNLLRRPGRYAGRPIRLNVLVIRAWRWEPGPDFRPTIHWTAKDGPFWRYDCLNADAPSPPEPVYVFSPLEPNVVLGKPDRIGDDGEWRYENNPQVEMAGVFYKVYSGKSVSGIPRDYPVVLAWQIRTGDKTAGGGVFTDPMRNLMMVVVMILAIGFLFLMRARQMRRLRAESKEPPGYRSPASRPQPQRDRPVKPEDEVDPDLKAAAEQYLQQRDEQNEPQGGGKPG